MNTEHELLQLFTKGDVKSFNLIYERYYRQLVYFAYVITNNKPHAEDVATEAFINLWKTKTTFKTHSHIRSFLFLSVKHRCLDFIRSLKTRSGIHDQIRYLALDGENSLERVLAESEIMNEISRQINTLPPQCRKVFSHLFFDGMATDEVASVMDITVKNVLNQKAIAIKQIRIGLLKKGLLTLILPFQDFFL